MRSNFVMISSKNSPHESQTKKSVHRVSGSRFQGEAASVTANDLSLPKDHETKSFYEQKAAHQRSSSIGLAGQSRRLFALKRSINVLENWTTGNPRTELRAKQETTGHLAMEAVGFFRRRTQAMLEHHRNQLERKKMQLVAFRVHFDSNSQNYATATTGY